ncbi:GH92 family glycosyl hydrolase [Flavobacteriales bacterium]|nr:GH92 family glycosyl hydrolase [Flavobacteriales bacterium]
MRYLIFSLGLLMSCSTEEKLLTDYVNPFIGTGGHGHTYPGVSSPFGMMQLSPDTRLEGWDGCGGYHYSDDEIYGFSHTHLSGTGVSDYGDILLIPTTGELLLINGSDVKKGYKSKFSHNNETAKAGYYSVNLEDYNIDVELTVSKRSGFHKYTYNSDKEAQLILDLEHRDRLTSSNIELVNNNSIKGWRHSSNWAEDQRLYFYIQLSEDISEVIYREDSLVAGFKFGEIENPLLVKVGISAVSIKNAKENLETEISHWDFNKTLEGTTKQWEEELGKIQIETENETKKEIFYTSLYHSLLNPNLFSDVNGDYLGMDLKAHNTTEKQYTIFSLWDTFRATHPLFTLIQQEKTLEFIKTFIRQYQDGGQLPVWELAANYTGCMIGYHSIPVIVDAYVKGISNFDTKLALEAMVHSANQNHLGLKQYKENGFISASDEPESVSKTLEYAYDDWCIAEFAKRIGNDSVASIFYERAQNYKNLFDPSTNFFRAKNSFSWFSPFKPEEVNFNYTEANAWQYSLFVPQDISGHIQLMEGNKNYETHLDNMFTASMETSGREQVDITGLIGQYAHGNEPSHHMAYLYNYIGKAAKTQKYVKQILEEQYSNLPDGLSGNEDCGQMSAWYVLSSLGFYSVTPGLDYYSIGTPLFKKSIINLENGNTFEIKANNVSDKNFYIQSATLNGEEYNKPYITHSEITNGGKIIFEMGKTPSYWGSTEIPISEIKDNIITAVPYFISESQTFTNQLKIEIGSAENTTIYFTTDGSKPNTNSEEYNSPILISDYTTLKAICIKNGIKSKMVSADYFKIDNSKTIQLISEYANQYSADGDKTLIDHLRGGDNYRTGNWQGYRGDLIADIDLGKIKEVSFFSIGFLQEIRSWIFFPKEIKIFISEDGETYSNLVTLSNTFPDDKEGTFTKDFTFEKGFKTKHIKIKAINYGFCPEWHLGSGGKTWLFADEIIIE